MSAKSISLIVPLFVIMGLSQPAQAVYTWTTPGVPTRVNVNQGCSTDAAKAFAWVYVPGYSNEFSFVTTTPSGQQMLDTLTKALEHGKRVELNYYGLGSGETPEYLNQRVYRYGKGNCNYEVNRFILIHGVSIR